MFAKQTTALMNVEWKVHKKTYRKLERKIQTKIVLTFHFPCIQVYSMRVGIYRTPVLIWWGIIVRERYLNHNAGYYTPLCIGNIFKSRQTNALLAYRDTWSDMTWDMPIFCYTISLIKTLSHCMFWVIYGIGCILFSARSIVMIGKNSTVAKIL